MLLGFVICGSCWITTQRKEEARGRKKIQHAEVCFSQRRVQRALLC